MKKLLIVLFILSLLLNAFLISKPYLIPDNEKQALQDSLDSCLVVNDSLKGELKEYGFYYTFQRIGAMSKSLDKYHLNDSIVIKVFLAATDLYKNNIGAYFEYQIIDQTQYNDRPIIDEDDIYKPNCFFDESMKIDTILYKDDFLYIDFSPKKSGKYYLRGFFYVPSNSGHYINYPLQTEINVVP